MECHCFPASELPHSTSLYTTYFADFSRVSQFYAHSPHWNEILRAVGEVRLDNSIRTSVVDVLREQNRAFGGDETTVRNLDRLRDGTVAVVTGQQVGLFGGPAFSVYKALTAIHLANELTAKGTNAVPVFWLATEDHDLAEVNHCYFGKRGAPERLELATPGLENRRVGEIRLGASVAEFSSRVAEMLEGTAAQEVAAWIAESYRPEETFGSAFGKLMTRIFAGRGLIFLDALSPELHRLSAATMIGAVKEHQALSQELVARSTTLEKAGFHAQVKVADPGTLVFRIVNGQRLVLRPNNGGFVAGNKQDSLEETLRAIELHPEEFSPNALLRPVIQDTLLPTVAYVGGPAEIAYHAQASIVYKKLLGRAPVILPRASFTLVTPHVANLLKKYKLDPKDAFVGRREFRARLEAEALPEELTGRFVEGEKSVQAMLDGLREPLSRLDQTLVGALDTVAEKMLYQFNGLRAKAGRAEGFRTGVLDAHEKDIGGLLLPNNELQERSLSMLTFLASYGRELLDHLDRQIKIGAAEHCVLDL